MSKKKIALITGISGQDGAYLAQLLLNKNYIVVGSDRRSARNDQWRLRKLKIENKIIFEELELAEVFEAERLFKKYNFDEVLAVIKGWIFHDNKSHHYLDKFFLGLDEKKTKGFRSMSILHYLGLKKEFKGIFKGKKISDAIEEMKNDPQDFSKILYYLCLKNFSRENDIFDNISISDSFVFPSQKLVLVQVKKNYILVMII